MTCMSLFVSGLWPFVSFKKFLDLSWVNDGYFNFKLNLIEREQAEGVRYWIIFFLFIFNL